MFSSTIKTLRQTTGFRLALLSSASFIVGTLFLFAFAYFLLSASLQARDRDSIDARLRQLAAQYQAADLAGLKRSLALESSIRKTKPYFIRIAGPSNALVFMEIPDQWAEFDLARLERLPLTELGSFMRLPANDDSAVLEIASLRLPDGSILQVGKSTDERDEILALFGWILAGVAIPVVVIGIASGAFLAVRALRPIRELIETVRAIDSGAMTARVPVRRTGDELDSLAQLFNGMLNRIAVLIEGMRGALDTVAHELRTPIARMRGAAEIALQSDRGTDIAREALSDCIEESDRILRLLDGLMDLSEAEAGTLVLKREPVDIVALVEEAIDLYRYVSEEKAISVALEAPDRVWVTADRGRLRQVMANLLDNATKYTPRGGRIDLKVSREKSTVAIAVADTGIGMTPQDLSRIWDRLYRGDRGRAQRGMGLGLSLVKAIVEAHGGQVVAASAPDSGSVFRITLPLASDSGRPVPPTGRAERTAI
ncbi:MAG: HAMP domain-containing histidine kinase [Rhizobiales bacterium]|nr:HAMP domain-containing histidine kinase [Hyphomicrobiales bacterium]